MRVEWIVGFFSMNFGSLTGFTTVNVMVDLSLDSWPPIILSDQLSCLVLSWMTCGCGVVVFLDNVCAKGVVRRYVNTLFVGNESLSMVFKVIVFGV